jgi:hypothetical protein
MTRKQYREARALIRANGRYALRWLDADARPVFDRLLFGYPKDWLAERAAIVAWCRRTGTTCNVRQTARPA